VSERRRSPRAPHRWKESRWRFLRNIRSRVRTGRAACCHELCARGGAPRLAMTWVATPPRLHVPRGARQPSHAPVCVSREAQGSRALRHGAPAGRGGNRRREALAGGASPLAVQRCAAGHKGASRALRGRILVSHDALASDPTPGFRSLSQGVGLEWTATADRVLASLNRPGRRTERARLASQLPEICRSRLRPISSPRSRHCSSASGSNLERGFFGSTVDRGRW
jgi:hypothetical protein